MDKNIIDILSKMVPADQLREFSEAVEKYLADARASLEAEAATKLEEAYASLASEIKDSESVAEQGYQEAYTVIQDLRNRIDTMRSEYEAAMDEGYEEAYQMLLAERSKAENVETEAYKAADERLSEIKGNMVNMLHEFLKFKGKEIHEAAVLEILKDPRMVEHKITLDRIVDTVSNYISDEDYSVVTNSKLDAVTKTNEELKGKMSILESRNIRLSTENTRLNEQVREATNMLNESVKTEKNARIEKAKNVQGRGKTSMEGVEVIPEHTDKTLDNKKPEVDNSAIMESLGVDLRSIQVLSGVKTND